MRNYIVATCVGLAVLSASCKDDERAKPSGGGSTPATPAPAATQPAASGEHNRLPIGETTMSGLKLVATMDEPVKPGGEGAFDVVITGGKPKAVRFWVGTESGEGSVKAKAEEETTDNWHTHAEVPDPLPVGSKFWVEVEPPSGDSFKAIVRSEGAVNQAVTTPTIPASSARPSRWWPRHTECPPPPAPWRTTVPILR